MYVLGQGLFCARCGAYSFTRTVKLHGSCSGRVVDSTINRRLGRLWAGRHPITGAAIGVPRVLGDPAEALYIYLDLPQAGSEEVP